MTASDQMFDFISDVNKIIYQKKFPKAKLELSQC